MITKDLLWKGIIEDLFEELSKEKLKFEEELTPLLNKSKPMGIREIIEQELKK